MVVALDYLLEIYDIYVITPRGAEAIRVRLFDMVD